MGNIWIASENPQAAARLLGPARQLGGDGVYAAILGGAAVESLACAGLDRVYRLMPEDGRPESAGGALADLIKQEGADIILFPATPRGEGIAASVAGLLDCGMASDAASITRTPGGFSITRPVYGGAGLCELDIRGTACATLAANAYAAPETCGRKAEVIEKRLPGDDRVKVISREDVKRESADLAAAQKVVCAGRGFEKEEDLAIARDLCAALGAELGCSRGIAEDLKWLPLDSYIGISGVKLHSDIYLALGVSGQAQHVSGIRDVKIIVAVDNNEKAPIFRAADYGIVGDLYDLGPAICRALKNQAG